MTGPATETSWKGTGIYAFGGFAGSRKLYSMEAYDLISNKLTTATSLLHMHTERRQLEMQ
eukprot:1503812-Ditylum_brightwellii.AAC.1